MPLAVSVEERYSFAILMLLFSMLALFIGGGGSPWEVQAAHQRVFSYPGKVLNCFVFTFVSKAVLILFFYT